MERKNLLSFLYWICLAVLFLTGTVTIVYSLKNSKPAAVKQALKTGLEGNLLPSFDMILVDSILKISSDRIPTNKSIVLFFFSPECPYCELQIKEIIKDIDWFGDIDFYVLTPFPFPKMKEFYDRHKLNRFSNIKTGVDRENIFYKYFGAKSVPYIAIYGKDKRLSKVFAGNISSKQIKDVSKE